MKAPNAATGNLAREKERTLRIAWLLSAWAPLATGLALYLGPSTILLADFLRRTSELIALFLSWLVFLRIARNPGADPLIFRKQEHQASLAVAAVMLFSLVVIAVNAIRRLAADAEVGWILPGMLIAVAGGGVNLWLWRRNRRLSRQEPGPLIDAQWRFYRAKTWIDACVILTLTGGALTREIGVSAWVDVTGSAVIAVFLLTTAWRIGRTALVGLRDR